MASVLDRIFAAKRLELEQRKRAAAFDEICELAAQAPVPRGFVAALSRRRPAIIAEIKRASPSKGDILPGLDPAIVAGSYAADGAAAISVLTDAHFKGSLDDLRIVRAAVDLPLLRKDFIFDDYQIHEARAAGADCILLILSMLARQQARDLADLAAELGMAVLVEVHDRAQLDDAEAIGARLIGINNRDLHTFKTDIGVTELLLAAYRGEALIVSESGIETPADIRRLYAAGARAFLIGESLLRGGDPSRRLSALVGALNETAAGGRVG
jgi:indole-3-glycerol phosphate synthase